MNLSRTPAPPSPVPWRWQLPATKRQLSPRANWLALQLREPAIEHAHCTTTIREPRNKGKLVGQKAPFKPKEIWAIRVRLQLGDRRREPRAGAVQPRHRQQASSRRSGQAARPRRLPRGRHRIPGDCSVAEDPTCGAVEITEPTRDAAGAWDQTRRAGCGGPAVSEPASGIGSSVDSPVRSNCEIVGRAARARPRQHGTHTLRRLLPASKRSLQPHSPI